MNFRTGSFSFRRERKERSAKFGHPPRTVSPLAKSRLIATSSLHSASRNRSDHVRLSLPLSPSSRALYLTPSLSFTPTTALSPFTPFFTLSPSSSYSFFLSAFLCSCVFPPSVSKVQFFPLLVVWFLTGYCNTVQCCTRSTKMCSCSLIRQ